MLSGIDNMKLTFLLMLIVALGLTACAQSENAKLEQSLQFEKKALELRLKKDFRGALREQLKAVELNPKDSKPLTILAGIYQEIHETENAPENLQMSKDVLEKAVKLNANDAVAHSMLADVLSQNGDKQKALAEWREAAKLEPTKIYYLTNVGVGQHLLDDNQSAKLTFQTILQKYPKHIYTLYRYAEVEVEEGNFNEAVDLFERAIGGESSEEGDEDFQQTARKRLGEVREKLKSKSPN